MPTNDTQQSGDVSISGQLLMLDDTTPHVACVVQAVIPPDRGGATVAATTFSNERGAYQFTNLAPGAYQVRCYTTRGYVYYQGEDERGEGSG